MSPICYEGENKRWVGVESTHPLFSQDLLRLDQALLSCPQLTLRSNNIFVSQTNDGTFLWREVIGFLAASEAADLDLKVSDKNYVLCAKIKLDDAWQGLPKELYSHADQLAPILKQLEIPNSYGDIVDFYWSLESHEIDSHSQELNWFLHINFERSSSSIFAF